MDQIERYSRQADLVPADKLADVFATVIGVGAIGRQVALQLAAIGVPQIQLIDFDSVEVPNLAAQGFLESDLGGTKVNAVVRLCTSINSGINIVSVRDRYRRKMEVGNVVFCCVDQIDVRELIWNSTKDKVKIFIDGRMTAEALRVLVTDQTEESKQYYPTTLFRPEETFEGSCTAKTTIYSSNVIAGIMVAQMTKKLRNMPVDYDIQFNLLTTELDAKGMRHICQDLASEDDDEAEF